MRGYYADKDEILARLRRVEGQVRGLQKMVENDEYCIDILTQVTAASNALKKVAVGLLDQHLLDASGDARAEAHLLDLDDARLFQDRRARAERPGEAQRGRHPRHRHQPDDQQLSSRDLLPLRHRRPARDLSAHDHAYSIDSSRVDSPSQGRMGRFLGEELSKGVETRRSERRSEWLAVT